MRTFLIFFILFVTVSCGDNPTEKTAKAIDVALTYLSQDECDKALKVLLESPDYNNAVFVQILSSAYACKANFDQINFIASDLSSIITTTQQEIFRTFSIMSLSSETIADSATFTSLLRSINTMLNSTSGAPSQAARTAKFGTRKAGDMGMQILFLNLTGLGKFLHFYGNVNASGAKGGGGGNSCFLDYNDPRAIALIGGATGACSTTTSGHPDLDQTTAAGRRRMCEGLMFVSNIIDTLNNLTLPTSTDLSVLSSLKTEIDSIKAAAEAVGLGTLINMTSQSECETYITTAANLNDLEFLYASLFEQGLL